jgi:hypothetical protein
MTGVENNTRAQCPLPFCICCVQYSTVVQYNIEAAPCKIFTLQNRFKPLLHGGLGRGGVGTMSSCTVLHSCHPVTYKILLMVYKFDLFIVVIYSIL